MPGYNVTLKNPLDKKVHRARKAGDTHRVREECRNIPRNDRRISMAKQTHELTEKHIQFIVDQKVFFVGTATADSRVNVSPKGMDSLRVVRNNQIIWLNVTGSGNETSAHVQMSPRMTLMFCAFEGAPLILRVYGTAKVIHRDDAQWDELFSLFNPLPGSRQIFVLDIDLVQTSCGEAVPYYSFVGERDNLNNWALKKGEEGLKRYRSEKNQFSIDGIPTHILAKGG